MPLGRLYSYLLVFLQFLFIFLLLIYAIPGNFTFFPITLVNLSILLSIWALYWMRKSKLRITPEVAVGAKLVKKGPYRLIRHPMYTSVLLFCLGLLWTNAYSTTLVFYALLFFDLCLKIRREEKLLRNAFPDYKQYAKKTRRLIPLIF